MQKLLSLGMTLAFLISSAPIFAQEQVNLPAGTGRETVQAACVTCHGLQTVVNSGGYTAEGWLGEVNLMIGRGAKVPKEQVAPMVEYLTKNYPGQPAPKAVIIAGPAKATFQEWALPAKGEFPHDPMAGPDGSIWYTGFQANLLGKVDPASGAIREYPLKTPKSAPHGLTYDRNGDVWFAAHDQPYIGKIDPKSGEITEYPLPAEARGAHTPLFDAKGNLWFTLITSDRVGWLNPQTKEVKIAVAPTKHSLPYGMVLTSKGIPIFAEFGTNKIATVYPDTMEIHEWTLPNAATRIRRLTTTADDMIYYADYSRGYLARFDPKTGNVVEWPSPGGPRSQPYAIAVLHGAIWYVESNTVPNALVRFDPATEKFQTWGIPSGGGVVRNMMVSKDGDHLVLAESGIDKVALVTVEREKLVSQSH